MNEGAGGVRLNNRPLIGAAMKRIAFLLAFLLVGLGFATAADEPAVTFYLQLVRGNDSAAPPAPDARPLGPKLSGCLRSIFKWEHYWELKRDAVTLPPGGKIRRRMSADREIEVERLDAEKAVVRIYCEGRPTRVATQNVKTRFAVIGGEKGQDQSWFIVVRRDEPQAN